jgi:ribosomal protein S18 acetylase RimI-like enzyme
MPVELIPFQQGEFEDYLENLLVRYTADKIAAGNVGPDNATETIRKEIDNLMPQGLQTPHHTYFQICDQESGNKVGILWVYYDPQDRRKQAFIYDLEVDEAYRRQGYASQALLALEDHLRRLGVQKIGLHVFGFNTEAQALYCKLGYEITNIQMAKRL